MELSLPNYQLIISALLLLLVLSVHLLHSQSRAKLPPGPWRLPIVGSIHHLALTWCGLRQPHQALRNLARLHGPVMRFPVGPINFMIITSREAAKEVLKIEEASFSHRFKLTGLIKLLGGKDFVFSNGPYQRQMRRICVTETLSPKRVRSVSRIRLEEVHSMLRELSNFSGKAPVKLAAKVGECTNNFVSRVIAGARCKEQAEFVKTLKDVSNLIIWISVSDLFPSLKWLDVKLRKMFERESRVLNARLEEIIKEHLEKKERYKNTGREEEMEYDMVDILIKAMENEDLEVPITLNDIKAVILDMFVAGVETSTTTIEWVMTELVKHPEVIAKAQAEVRRIASESADRDQFGAGDHDLTKLSYLKLVIKETLRLHPPVPLIPRQSSETCQLLGYTIPKRVPVLTNAWALGRDPDYWDNADEFIPERFEGSGIDFRGNDFELLPFGAGRRNCPGMRFATAIVEVTLAKLLLHFDWKLPHGVEPNDIDMTDEFGATCCKKNSLLLIPILRVPLPDI